MKYRKGHNSLGNHEIRVTISDLMFHTTSNILNAHCLYNSRKKIRSKEGLEGFT